MIVSMPPSGFSLVENYSFLETTKNRHVHRAHCAQLPQIDTFKNVSKLMNTHRTWFMEIQMWIYAPYICVRVDPKSVSTLSLSFCLLTDFRLSKIACLQCLVFLNVLNSSEPEIWVMLFGGEPKIPTVSICQQKCRKEKLISTLIWISPRTVDFNDQVGREKIICKLCGRSLRFDAHSARPHLRR